MNLKKQVAGKRINAADMKVIKGSWRGWDDGCQTAGACVTADDCQVFPAGCFSTSPIVLECFNNNCILLNGYLA